MWIHWPFFAKIWTKGHWPLDDLWPHVCWGHMCDSRQGSLCPSPMTIHQCMWIQWSILQNTTYIHIHTYTYIHTTYRMSDYIVSYWTQFRRDNNSSRQPPWAGNTCNRQDFAIYIQKRLYLLALQIKNRMWALPIVLECWPNVHCKVSIIGCFHQWPHMTFDLSCYLWHLAHRLISRIA